MIRIFIGYDKKESVAAYVLAHSIHKRSSMPVSITFLNRDNLRGVYDRPKGEFDSTDFSNSRFIVPYLCNYEGYAVFMDCDMLCLGDVSEFANFMTLHTRWTQSVHVVKHKHVPKEETKFLGAIQTKYEKKNWSSVMVFNNAMCRELTVDAVNKKPGLWLHQFGWTDRVGGLPAEWNCLVGQPMGERPPKLIHYTEGTPCFDAYKDCEFSDIWHAEREDMLSHA